VLSSVVAACSKKCSTINRCGENGFAHGPSSKRKRPVNVDDKDGGPSTPMIADVRESARFEIFRGAPTRRVMIATTPQQQRSHFPTICR
jgi:hypothetical protein